ncbi:hypothetical protein BFP70_00630 [Thioclava sp. SK-1]|uniref:hypothetical protein n=1 Tax=Thioclava sp. SK-1 TaxID=1889770 RepID=UPI00082439C2|nr:hypothetical protein [Thioclava sp. SK-1]OCX66698.1 hypothetical protein BFP70_00630 [Thioclava sp. SK-1]
MRILICALPMVLLAACQPSVPNSGAGVGFGSYEEYLAAREAELRGQQTPPAVTPTGAPLDATHGPAYGGAGYGASVADPAQIGSVAPTQPMNDAQQLGADTLAALNATAAEPITVQPSPSVPPAASSTALPQLDVQSQVVGQAGPNLAAYALSVNNQPGQSVYRRGGIKLTSTARACAKYVAPDLAQIAFLDRGGPERDPGNLDPDGDGFACGWDPSAFQNARGN